MTTAEATTAVRERWGMHAFARRVRAANPHQRFVIGYVGNHGPVPIAWGRSFEAAIERASAGGFTREFIEDVRAKAGDAPGNRPPVDGDHGFITITRSPEETPNAD